MMLLFPVYDIVVMPFHTSNGSTFCLNKPIKKFLVFLLYQCILRVTAQQVAAWRWTLINSNQKVRDSDNKGLSNCSTISKLHQVYATIRQEVAAWTPVVDPASSWLWQALLQGSSCLFVTVTSVQPGWMARAVTCLALGGAPWTCCDHPFYEEIN